MGRNPRVSKETREAHVTSILFYTVVHVMIFLIFFLYENQLRSKIREGNYFYIFFLFALVVLETILFAIAGISNQEKLQA